MIVETDIMEERMNDIAREFYRIICYHLAEMLWDSIFPPQEEERKK